MDPVLHLFADEQRLVRDGDHPPAATTTLYGLLKVPPHTADAGSDDPVLTVTAPDGQARKHRGLTLHPPPGPGAIARWIHGVTLATDGVHTAQWRLGDHASPPLALHVRAAGAPDPAAGPALTVEALRPAGIAGEPRLHVRLHHRGRDPLDRPGVFADVHALIDGAPARYRFGAYHGAATVAPGASVWTLLSLERFDPAPGPGDHTVVLTFGGEVAAPVFVPAR